MFDSFYNDGTAIEPAQLDLLRSALDTICERRQIAPTSDAAKDMAAALVRLHQAGFRDRAELLHMLDEEIKIEM